MPTPRDFMIMAIDQAKLSVAEHERISPKVGAVMVLGDQVMGVAHRGEDTKHGEHAEFRLLEIKLQSMLLAGGTLYTTLEPCMRRGSDKKPCALHILERKIDKVVIGILDPDPTVHGKGQMFLLKHNIQVGNFDPDLTSQILEMNRKFIEDREAPRMTIDEPNDGQSFPRGEITVKGKYRVESASADRMALFTRRGKTYWPQGRFVANTDGTWECTITENQLGETTIIAAHVDPNCELWINHYLTVAKNLTDPKRWVGLEIEKLPSGIRVDKYIKIRTQ